MADAQLLQLLKTRPDDALTQISKRYSPLAMAIAGRVLPGRQQDLEEIASEVLIRIWQKQDSLNPETLRGFVITTARNLAIDLWRQLRRREEVPIFDHDQEDSEYLESQVLTDLLLEQIRAMSPPDGEIFLRHYLLLETAGEIAGYYGLTESAVRSRLHRIRKQLQKEVRP